MAKTTTLTQRTDTAITAATATLITLAVLAINRVLGRHSSVARAATELADHDSAKLAAEADVLHAVATHRDAVLRGERPIHAVPELGRRHPRRTG